MNHTVFCVDSIKYQLLRAIGTLRNGTERNNKFQKLKSESMFLINAGKDDGRSVFLDIIMNERSKTFFSDLPMRQIHDNLSGHACISTGYFPLLYIITHFTYEDEI